jgi:hypothetical protein
VPGADMTIAFAQPEASARLSGAITVYAGGRGRHGGCGAFGCFCARRVRIGLWPAHAILTVKAERRIRHDRP